MSFTLNLDPYAFGINDILGTSKDLFFMAVHDLDRYRTILHAHSCTTGEYAGYLNAEELELEKGDTIIDIGCGEEGLLHLWIRRYIAAPHGRVLRSLTKRRQQEEPKDRLVVYKLNC